VRIASDADVQGLAVIAGKGLEMIITLGTGVGTGLYLDGRPASIASVRIALGLAPPFSSPRRSVLGFLFRARGRFICDAPTRTLLGREILAPRPRTKWTSKEMTARMTRAPPIGPRFHVDRPKLLWDQGPIGRQGNVD
jgi:hypothetical protein